VYLRFLNKLCNSYVRHGGIQYMVNTEGWISSYISQYQLRFLSFDKHGQDYSSIKMTMILDSIT